MKLKDLMREAHLECRAGYEDDVCTVVSDSRLVKRGCIFVCVEGSHFNGHSFAREALEAGAAAVVVERGKIPLYDARIVEADNTRRALSYLLDAFYGHPANEMHLVGVTGTNGKTSLTYILKAIFEEAGYRCGVIGTLGSYLGAKRIEFPRSDALANMTTPDPEELYFVLDAMRSGGARYVFMEASSHALYYEKLAPLEFDCALFTNLTPEHLDFHGSISAYLDAKLKLLDRARLAVINFDSPYREAVKRRCERYVSCSISSSDADYTAENVNISLNEGMRYLLECKRERFEVSSLLVGDFNVMNTLMAIATAMELGIDKDTLRRALRSFAGVSGRLERLDLGEDISVFVDYAHTPDALENVLSTLRKIKKDGDRITLLFGCGGDRDKSKRAEMGRIGTTLSDFSIITSDNCRSEMRGAILSDILNGVGNASNYVVVPDRKDALRLAAKLALQGDTVLLAGKGHEKYEIIGNEKLPFDEHEIIKGLIAYFGVRMKGNGTNENTSGKG